MNGRESCGVRRRKAHASTKYTIVLFGPPGIGKSALCATAVWHDISAVDLEMIGYEQRKALVERPGWVDALKQFDLVGAADLPPSAFKAPHFRRVALNMKYEDYVRRRAARDAAAPRKAGQKWANDEASYDEMIASLMAACDVVYDFSPGATPDRALHEIFDLVDEYMSNNETNRVNNSR